MLMYATSSMRTHIIYMCIRTYIYIYIYTCTYVRMYVCMYVCKLCVYIYIYIYVYVYTYEYVYVYVYVCVGTQKYGNRSVQLLAVQQTLEAERPQDKNRPATHA